MDMRQIQKALADRGLYRGKIDGDYGRLTMAATAEFQKSVGLYVDGIPGPKTQMWLALPVDPKNVIVLPARQSMSQIGLKALISREDLRTKAYRDSVGIWTIGVGHTAAAGAPAPHAGMTITREEAEAIFARDLVQYEDAVRDAIKVNLADHQFDSLASICFNIGAGGLHGSSFVKRINEGASRTVIRSAILKWRKPPEIISRRTAEADQFETPYSVRLPKGRSNDASPIKL